MIQELRQLLSECHLKSGQLTKILEEADSGFTLTRAREEIEYAVSARKADMNHLAEVKLKLAIQLLNMTRFKLKAENESAQNQRSEGAGS